MSGGIEKQAERMTPEIVGVSTSYLSAVEKTMAPNDWVLLI